jgi:hypothetical protein
MKRKTKASGELSCSGERPFARCVAWAAVDTKMRNMLILVIQYERHTEEKSMKRAFMVMPFTDDIVRQGYEHCVKPVFKQKGIEIRKADEIFSVNPIYDDIVQEIQNAQIVVVDISTKNTNVFYELGIAHTLKQSQTIILTHDKIDYILADYVTIFRDEYQTIMEVLDYADKRGDFYSLIGLHDTGGVSKIGKKFGSEGHYKNEDKGLQSYTKSLTGKYIDTVLDTFSKLNYTKLEGGSIYITDKGKGFVEFLKMNGYVCDVFNDIVITKGYIPSEKRKKKTKPKK